MRMTEEMLATFNALLAEARASADPEPTAMVLATATPEGDMSARTVLLKGHDARGFVFYTNSLSTKGRQLAANPRASLLFLWKHIRNQVQVRIDGPVERIDDAESDAYFASRPRESQLGAWASLQSEVLDSRETFERRYAQFEAEFAGRPVPRPPHWFGYRVSPVRVEFWYGRPYRLHERIVHEWCDGEWRTSMRYP
jgi:pyridoxamine 5'-phosphate oxidase